MTDTIRVATLNVCGLPSSLPALRPRAAEFCRRLTEMDVDVVMFQEVWTRRSNVANWSCCTGPYPARLVTPPW